MVSPKTIQVMNRLAVIHGRSLASYLNYASPTWHRGDEKARQALADITAQQLETVDRIAEWILEHDGVVSRGSYPMVYTAYHDLSFDFLLNRLIEHQQQDVAAIQACLGQLDDARAREMAQESLGEAKAHLDMLRELLRPNTTAMHS
jgi:hypothetical protein